MRLPHDVLDEGVKNFYIKRTFFHRNQIWQQTDTQVWGQVKDKVFDTIWTPVSRSASSQLTDQVIRKIKRNIRFKLDRP